MVLRFFLLAATFLFISCTDFERNNPEDPGSNKYVANQLQSSSSVGYVSGTSSVGGTTSPSSSSKQSSSSITAKSSSSSAIIIDPCPNVITGNNTVSCGGKTYKTIKINSQVWMAENLNYVVAGSKCGGDDRKLKDENTSNCDTYGRLYNWATAMDLDASCNYSSCALKVGAKHRGICPESWHLPNNDDWDKLVNYVESSNGCTNCVAKYLKTSDWGGEDKYSFSALPGGFGYLDGDFYNVGYYGGWWSASENNSDNAYYLGMSYDYDGGSVSYDLYYKYYLRSVRCVKD